MKNRKRNRLKGYDYSKNNLYFITSCVKNRVCCFGDVVPVGTGRDLSVHHPDKIHPDKIHPDKIHPDKIHPDKIHPDENHPDKIHPDKNQGEMILNQFGIIANNQLEWLENQYPYIIIHSFIIMPNHVHAIIEIDSNLFSSNVKIKSLSQIMGAYKTTSSKLIHESGYADFAWHRSFHDHIIKDEKAYLNIVNYINNNPNNWFKDKFYNN